MKTWAAVAIGAVFAGCAVASLADSRGKAVYEQTCIACHGADGKGAVPGAPDLTKKGGPLAKADAVLLENMIKGFQTPGSPMAMPPRGGNPTLTEDDLKAVLRYMRAAFCS